MRDFMKDQWIIKFLIQFFMYLFLIVLMIIILYLILIIVFFVFKLGNIVVFMFEWLDSWMLNNFMRLFNEILYFDWYKNILIIVVVMMIM